MAAARRRHRWIADSCVRCGLHREEVWVADAEGRPVTAVVWSRRGGPVMVQPFPPMKAIVPDPPPRQTVATRFPGVSTGTEPACAEPPS